MRLGRCSDQTRLLLQGCLRRTLPDDDGVGAATRLCSHVKDCERINTACLAELPGEIKTFRARDTGRDDASLAQLREHFTEVCAELDEKFTVENASQDERNRAEALATCGTVAREWAVPGLLWKERVHGDFGADVLAYGPWRRRYLELRESLLEEEAGTYAGLC